MDFRWKLISTGATVLAAFAAGKVAEQAWKLATGATAPMDDDDDASLIQLVVYSAASAVLVTVAQRYALRGVKKFYTPKLDK